MATHSPTGTPARDSTAWNSGAWAVAAAAAGLLVLLLQRLLQLLLHPCLHPCLHRLLHRMLLLLQRLRPRLLLLLLQRAQRRRTPSASDTESALPCDGARAGPALKVAAMERLRGSEGVELEPQQLLMSHYLLYIV